MTRPLTRGIDHLGAKGQVLSVRHKKFGDDSYVVFPYFVYVGAAGAPLAGGRYER